VSLRSCSRWVTRICLRLSDASCFSATFFLEVCQPYRIRASLTATNRVRFKIWGLTVADGRIFVVGLQSDIVHVYADKPPTYNHLGYIRVNGLRYPTDIVSCSLTGTLYIADADSRNRLCLMKVPVAGVPLITLVNLFVFKATIGSVSRVGAVALYTVLWTVVVKYRKWPFSAPRRTKTS
jgi:hypothetical protein